jgi:uncharacterized protein (DUF58 family)
MSLPRPGRRALGLVVAALLLFVVGTNDQAGWLFVLAALLLGTAVAGAVLPGGMVRNLSVRRTAPREVFQGSEARVDVVVENLGHRPKRALLLRDGHLQPTTCWLPRLDPGEGVALSTVRRAARRGVMEGDRVRVSSGAPFGVARVARDIEAPCRTVVYPRVVPLRLESSGSGRPQQHTDHAGIRRGSGHDFLGIRDYQVGDSMRHVHWPSTARMGALMVREFEKEQSSQSGILVDAWADGGTEDTPLDMACSVAASVALAFLDSGEGVELAAARSGRVERLPGRDRAEVLGWLAALQADGAMPMGAAAAEATPFLTRCDVAVLVLPTWRTALDITGPAADVAGAGVRVLAVLIDAATFDGDRARPPTLNPQEIEGLERTLAAAGVDTCRVGAGDDLAVRLGATLGGSR